MMKEENLKLKPKENKLKLVLVILKTLPFLLALISVGTTILDYNNINSTFLNYIFFFLLYSFVYISSYIFKFCSYFRLPLNYILIINIISIIDEYIGIPLSSYRLMQFYIIFTLIFIFYTIFKYVKSNKRIIIKDS